MDVKVRVIVNTIFLVSLPIKDGEQRAMWNVMHLDDALSGVAKAKFAWHVLIFLNHHGHGHFAGEFSVARFEENILTFGNF